MPSTSESHGAQRLNRPGWFVVGAALVGIIGMADAASGTELSFGLFYLIPIALVTWFARQRYGLALSAVAAIVWFLADAAAGHSYSHPEIRYWNAGVRLGFFVVVTVLLPAIRARDRALIIAGIDELTGASNRRRFLEDGQRELTRSQRFHRPFSLVYFDLDGFKAVNDRHGHGAGDNVLRAIASRARAQLRAVDMLARIGGDEFIVLLPETDAAGCQAIVSKLTSALLDEMRENGWPVTFSVGALTYQTGSATLQALIARTDALMYSVKRGGKNGVAYDVWTG